MIKFQKLCKRRIIIQIQHLLKLNAVYLLQIVLAALYSNTTLVKVKLRKTLHLYNKTEYSNTTLVKVKYPNNNRKTAIRLKFKYNTC